MLKHKSKKKMPAVSTPETSGKAQDKKLWSPPAKIPQDSNFLYSPQEDVGDSGGMVLVANVQGGRRTSLPVTPDSKRSPGTSGKSRARQITTNVEALEQFRRNLAEKHHLMKKISDLDLEELTEQVSERNERAIDEDKIRATTGFLTLYYSTQFVFVWLAALASPLIH